jgi:hypothetical protein
MKLWNSLKKDTNIIHPFLYVAKLFTQLTDKKKMIEQEKIKYN